MIFNKTKNRAKTDEFSNVTMQVGYGQSWLVLFSILTHFKGGRIKDF